MQEWYYKLINFFKTLTIATTNRITPQQVSLHWGGHRENHWNQELESGIGQFINEFVLEPSPSVIVTVNDPIIDSYLRRHSFHDRALVRLRDSTFDPYSGNIFVGNRFISESHSHRGNSEIRRSLKTVSFGNRPIIGVPQQTHYHWLIESLPRIIKAARYERDAILIAPTGLGGVQRSALEILGNEIVYTDNRCTSNNLILATHSDDSGWAHPSDLELLRKTYQVPTESGSQYLFVTRVNSRRSDAMSKTIENFARRTGWTIVRAEELSWSEHLDLFGHAKAIAGEHGAGLANLALAPKYCNLQELLRRDCANPCYAALSVSLNGNGLCYRLIGLDRYEELLMS